MNLIRNSDVLETRFPSRRALMQAQLAILLAMLAASKAVAAPALACPKPDLTFAAFFYKFKNQQNFRESRLVLPLVIASRDNSKTNITRYSAAQIHSNRMRLIRGEAAARELSDTEGRLCEGKPKVGRNHAQITQSSCETDVYSDLYSFLRRDGCWFLEKIETSGL